jgi:hypothetical protein
MLMVNQLCGFGAGGEAAPALASVSNVGNASSTAATITWPSVQAGDMAILFDVGAGSPGLVPGAVTPSGFTNMCNVTDGISVRAMTSFKMCTGAESGSLTGMNGFLSNKKGMLILRGDITFASISGAGAQNGALSSGNPGAIVVAASAGSPPLLVIGCYNSSGAIDPRTFSTTKDGEQAFHANTMWIAWKLYLASPADSSIDEDDEGSNNLIQGFYANLTI